MDTRDKSKTYTTDYGTFTITNFWFPGTKEINAGWMYEVKNK